MYVSTLRSYRALQSPNGIVFNADMQISAQLARQCHIRNILILLASSEQRTDVTFRHSRHSLHHTDRCAAHLLKYHFDDDDAQTGKPYSSPDAPLLNPITSHQQSNNPASFLKDARLPSNELSETSKPRCEL